MRRWTSLWRRFLPLLNLLKVIYIDDDINRISPEELEKELNLLPPLRREKAISFKHFSGRVNCCKSFLLLLKAIRAEFGIETTEDFDIAENGKPYFSRHPFVHFNISHCKTVIACAVGDRPIGIDVENIQMRNDSLLKYAFNEKEIQQIHRAIFPELEFTKLWTMKESLFKLYGSGITHEIKDILKTCDSKYQFNTIVNFEKNYVITECREFK